MTVPYTFGNTTAPSIPLSRLDDNFAAVGNSTNISFTQNGIGAVAQTVQSKLRETVSVFDFMTMAEQAAVLSYSFTTDVTTSCQNALNSARANNLNCYFPAGGYLVTGLIIPGDVNPPVDDRDSGMRIYGQGFGEPFVTANTGGTVIKSVSNAPVLKDILGTNPSSNGTIEIDTIRFDGTSSTPVIFLESFYGLSSMHNCVVYQRGTGDGIRVTYSAGIWIYMVWALNGDWNSYSLGAARTGIGFNLPLSYDSGLSTISKCTSRGWLTAYQIGGGAGTPYSNTVEQSECSVVYNGVILSGTNKAVVDSMYMEGLDGGTAIDNLGVYSTISNNLIFSGASIGIKSELISNRGAVINGNTIGLGNIVGAYGIKLAGAYGQEVTGNAVSCTDGTANQIGVYVDVQGKVDVHANAFDPKETWSGSGSSKVAYSSSSLIQGIITGQSNNVDFPVMSQGALSLAYAPLTGANVAATILTVPDGGYFVVTAAAPVTVNRLDAGIIPNRLITFRTTNDRMTFANTSYIFLNVASGAFAGPGTITFVVERVLGASYAYEISRTVL